jgi:DNA-binding Lrp family transcriptional regulator
MTDALDLALLNDFQRGFPLEARPFAAIAARVGATEEEVLARYRSLAQAGVVSRIGAVFRPNAAGASTLAAMVVPPGRLEEVAGFVSAQPEVNHNYEREHSLNLWFVLAAASPARLAQALGRIERETALPVLALPLEEEFHIDLGFDLRTGLSPRAAPPPAARLDESLRPLAVALQEGLPLVAEPYAALGRVAGMGSAEVRRSLAALLESGVVRRLGVVVRHRPLGYQANAMVVWDVPDAEVRRAGLRVAAEPDVTLCYRRTRRPPLWRYNLFCMIHGRERAAVRSRVAALRDAVGLAATPHAVLFSRRCFKQRGAIYAGAAEAAHG